MKVQVTRQAESGVSLEIEVSSAAVGGAIERAYRRLSQRVNVPGFRKGKAPRAVLEQRIGQAAVLEEAVDVAINEAYRQALEETRLEPVSQPEIDIKGEGLDPSQPFVFTATFYVQPEVQLGDYRAIRVEPVTSQVSDEDIDQILTRMAATDAPWQTLEEGTAASNDVAIIRLKGTLGDEVIVDEEEHEQFLSPLAVEEPETPTVTTRIIGMTVGESRDFTLPAPAETAPDEATAERETEKASEILYHVELRRLERRISPPIDDAFAQASGDFSTVAELREAVRESLQSQRQVEDAEQFVEMVTERAVLEATLELPPPFVEEEIHRSLDSFRASLEQERHLTIDLYLRVMNKTMEDLHEQMREPSVRRVKTNLVLDAIASAEEIEAPRAAVDAQLQEIVALPTVREQDRRRVMTSPTMRARIETRLKRRLALQRLLAIANPSDNLADTNNTEATETQQVMQRAAESHVDALELPNGALSTEETDE